MGATQPEGIVFRRSRLQRLLVLLAYAVLLASLTRLSSITMTDHVPYADAVPGEIARESVRAGFRFLAEDLAETRKVRDEAASAVPETYSVDAERVQNRMRTFRERANTLLGARETVDAAMREELAGSTSDQSASDLMERAVAGVAERLAQNPPFEGVADAEALAFWLTPTAGSVPRREYAPPRDESETQEDRPVEVLLEPEQTPLRFAREHLLDVIEDELEYVLAQGVIPAGVQALGRERQDQIRIIRDRRLDDLELSQTVPLSEVPRPAEAQDALRARLERALADAGGQVVEDEQEFRTLLDAAWALAGDTVTDTLVFENVATSRDREEARRAAGTVTKEIKAYETIQEEGTQWTAQSISDARTYWDIMADGQRSVTSVLSALAAHAIFAALALLCLLRYVANYSENRHIVRDQNLALLLMCSALVLGRIASYFEPSGFVVPVTAVAILYAILVRGRMAIMLSLLTAALVSVQYGYDWALLMVVAGMSIAAVFSTYVVRKRSDMGQAAIAATGVGALVMVAVMLASDSLFSELAMRRLLLIGLNGGLCMFIVPGVLPPLERLFGITTDIQLLEYSDLNNEVLSEMAMEVPATYAHSLMIGHLAEAAAQAIGANGLLARVCAYYHDIGKMRRPEYFSENQTGVNIHDDLSPRLSARAIASHVSYGAEVAREYRLPKPIVDAIYEHHGTMLIGFFYNQALEQQKHGDVREEDFRYPGPRPQSRETAILMICDAVESGVRSLKSPNEERIREFVDKIVSSRAEDRQFDECPLTLRDLDVIADVVSRRVLSQMHPRIAYPDRPGKDRTEKTDKAENVIAMTGAQER